MIHNDVFPAARNNLIIGLAPQCHHHLFYYPMICMQFTFILLCIIPGVGEAHGAHGEEIGDYHEGDVVPESQSQTLL